MRLTCQSLLLFMVLAAAAAAQDAEDAWPTLEAVTAKLSEPDVLRGRYTQTRQIALLSRPLESSGQFLLSDRGLHWQQEEPFMTVLIADGERLVQRLADGPAISMDASDQPMILSFSRIFLSLFRGDRRCVGRSFRYPVREGRRCLGNRTDADQLPTLRGH